MSFMPDSRLFRETVGHYASGITVIAGILDGQPVGFTCQSFHSLSLEPPLVSFSVMHSSTSWPKIRAAGTFSVNILASGQREISNAFARSGGDKWQGVAWSGTSSGNPVIEGSLAWVDCTLYEEHLAGDHRIVIGLVNDMSAAQPDKDQQPLIFFKGRYIEPA